MVVGGNHESIPARRLAKRLRDLRKREYQQLTQGQLAKALGGAERLSTATISQWEKPGSDPPPRRLAAYARLFCTSRSLSPDGLRLLRDDELTDQERQRETELYAELIALRDRAQASDEPLLGTGQQCSIWHFPDENEVSIVCPNAPDPPSYASHDHLNYTRSAKYADLDALIELHGQVKAVNPKSMIRIMLPGELTPELVLQHLIIIGGAVVEAVTPTSADTHQVRLPMFDRRLFAPDIPLPIARLIPGTETHFFDCSVGSEKREFRSLRDDNETLIQDIGLIGRCPHPITPGRTVTVLSGITSRGVHGAALCLADSHVRDANEQYLRDTFASTDRFCILMQVPVQNDVALPPNLGLDATVLYEWSDQTGARW
jgi:transcriptional regulator with XRE-family HTH domain